MSLAFWWKSLVPTDRFLLFSFSLSFSAFPPPLTLSIYLCRALIRLEIFLSSFRPSLYERDRKNCWKTEIAPVHAQVYAQRPSTSPDSVVRTTSCSCISALSARLSTTRTPYFLCIYALYQIYTIIPLSLLFFIFPSLYLSRSRTSNHFFFLQFMTHSYVHPFDLFRRLFFIPRI